MTVTENYISCTNHVFEKEGGNGFQKKVVVRRTGHTNQEGCTTVWNSLTSVCVFIPLFNKTLHPMSYFFLSPETLLLQFNISAFWSWWDSKKTLRKSPRGFKQRAQSYEWETETKDQVDIGEDRKQRSGAQWGLVHKHLTWQGTHEAGLVFSTFAASCRVQWEEFFEKACWKTHWK